MSRWTGQLRMKYSWFWKNFSYLLSSATSLNQYGFSLNGSQLVTSFLTSKFSCNENSFTEYSSGLFRNERSQRTAVERVPRNTKISNSSFCALAFYPTPYKTILMVHILGLDYRWAKPTKMWETFIICTLLFAGHTQHVHRIKSRCGSCYYCQHADYRHPVTWWILFRTFNDCIYFGIVNHDKLGNEILVYLFSSSTHAAF